MLSTKSYFYNNKKNIALFCLYSIFSYFELMTDLIILCAENNFKIYHFM